jgi:WD40 repeat protein
VARWVQRHRALSAALAALALALTFGAVGILVMWLRAERAAEAEMVQRRRAEEELWQSLVAVAQRERASGQAGGASRAMDAVRRASVIRPGVELRDEAIAALVMPDFSAPQANVWNAPLTGRILIHPQFSPAMDCACLVARDGNAKIVDARTGADLHPLAGGALPVRRGSPPQLACITPTFSPGGRWIVTVLPADASGRGSPCNLLLWSTADGAAHPIPAEAGVVQWTWSADESVLGLMRSDHLERIALPALRSLGRTPLASGWRGPGLSPDGNRLAIGYDCILHILEAASGRQLHTFSHQKTLENPAWSADGALLAVGTHDNRITVWDTASGLKWAVCNGHDNRPSLLEFLPSGVLLSGAWDYTTRVWNPWTGRPLLTMPTPDWKVMVPGSRGSMVHYTPSGPLGVAAVQRFRPQQAIRTIRPPMLPNEDAPGANALTFTADGALLCAASSSGVCVWDAETLHFLGTQTTKGHGLSAQAVNARTLLFSAAHSGVMHTTLTWQPGQETVIFSPPQSALSSDPHAKPPGHVNYMAAAGERIAISCVSAESPQGRQVEIWERGSLIRRWDTGAQWPVLSLSPDGKWLATGGAGYPLLLPAEAGLTAPLEALVLEKNAYSTWHCAMAPDGRSVAFQGEQHIDIWEIPSRRLLHRIPRLSGAQGKLVAYSPDGKLLAALGRKWDIWLIDPSTGLRLATLTPPEPFMTGALAFSPDSTRLAAGRVDGTIQIWELPHLRRLLAVEGLDWEE